MASGNGNGRGIRQRVGEMIGRWASPVIVRLQPFLTVDWTRADYAFWGRLRRGKERTYALGGLFAKPIAGILASFMLGKGVTITLAESRAVAQAPEGMAGGLIPPGDGEERDQRRGAERQEAQSRTEKDEEITNQALAAFVQENLATLIAWVEDSLGEGDAYLVVNADGSLTRVTPDAVEIVSEPEGSQHVVGYRITTNLPKMNIIDEYRADTRTLKIRKEGGERAQTFTNPAGKIPVIHLPCEPEANEMHGHPVYEALLKLFAEYDDTITKSLRGVKIMGNPIPVVEGLEDPEAAMKLNSTGTETYTDAEGNSQSKYVVDFSQVEGIWLGKGGSLKFASPGQFAQDAMGLLKKLFFVMLEHSRIPEWVWGGAVASSKASVDAQAPAFELNIEGWRLRLEGALRQLCEVWLATVGLWTPGIVADGVLGFDWPLILPEDKETKLKYIVAAKQEGVITEATFLRLLGLVDDPAAEVEAAKEEAKERQAAFQDTTDRAIDEELKATNSPPPNPLPAAQRGGKGQRMEAEPEEMAA